MIEISSLDETFATDNDFWEKLDSIIDILKYPADKMTKLQRKDLTLTDAYVLPLVITQTSAINAGTDRAHKKSCGNDGSSGEKGIENKINDGGYVLRSQSPMFARC